jgi:1-acyl-sn-glycerol-3-phosphate acyltransferase
VGSPLRAFIRIGAYLSLTFVLMPVQLIALALGSEAAMKLPLFYHRLCARILGFQIRIHGKIERKGPVLFACNHTSYTDIAILGSILPASFVAKAEVASWPLFGILAKLQRTVFVARRGPKAAAQRDEMIRRLERGDNLILFPEGTSSDGNAVLPFKSALFSVAQVRPNDAPLRVQPVSVAYTRLDGMPIGRALRPYFAWYGDMTLAPHFWALAGLGHATVDVVFHPPVTIDAYGNRKQLADACFEVVARGVSAANAGRLDELVAAA